jgi:hypothetical protein
MTNYVDEAWRYEKHAGDTLGARTNFFLVAEAFLPGAFAEIVDDRPFPEEI